MCKKECDPILLQPCWYHKVGIRRSMNLSQQIILNVNEIVYCFVSHLDFQTVITIAFYELTWNLTDPYSYYKNLCLVKVLSDVIN